MGMTSALHITHSIIVMVTFADYITLNIMGMTSVDYITQHLESSDVNIISSLFLLQGDFLLCKVHKQLK